MNQSLALVFRTQGGKKVTFTVPNPVAELSASSVNSAMECLIAENIFTSSSGDLQEIVEAKVLNQETTYLIASV